MIDDHGEEIWLDLKLTYGFDLVDFLAGGVASSPRLILSMIHNLPEGSRYVAAITAEREESGMYDVQESEEPSPVDPITEHLTWTTDRVLMAQLINAVNMLVRYSIQWEKPLDLPLVGPEKWREGEKKPRKAVSVMDVIHRITGQNG